MQLHNRSWHFHSASACPVFCGFFYWPYYWICTCRFPKPSWPLAMPGGIRTCAVGGKGWACLRRNIFHASFFLLTPSTPWLAFNYPIHAVLTAGHETQLWEANKHADLEKACLYTYGPGGFKGHYIGECAGQSWKHWQCRSHQPLLCLFAMSCCFETRVHVLDACFHMKIGAVLQFRQRLCFSQLNPDITAVSEGLRGHIKTFEHPLGSHSH